jgi:hypothetical protein
MTQHKEKTTISGQINQPIPDCAITPAAFARRLGVGVHKVLAWIDRGELGAINVASDPSALKRPKRWKILPEHVAKFEALRSANPRASLARRHRKKKYAGFKEYY